MLDVGKRKKSAAAFRKAKLHEDCKFCSFMLNYLKSSNTDSNLTLDLGSDDQVEDITIVPTQ